MAEKTRNIGIALIVIAMVFYNYEKYTVSGIFGFIGFILMFSSFFFNKKKN